MPRSLLALITLCLFCLAPAVADQKGKGKGHDKKHSSSAESRSALVAVDIFVGEDCDIVREYVTHYPGGGLPPGLAKRGGDLPPGLRKHLRRTGTLPPGLRKKLAPFPSELEARLRPLRPDLKRAFIEGRAVIYNEKTSVVLDVFIPF